MAGSYGGPALVMATLALIPASLKSFRDSGPGLDDAHRPHRRPERPRREVPAPSQFNGLWE